MKQRQVGGVFRTQIKRGINSLGASLNIEWRPFLVIPPNTDIIMTAEADTSGTAVSAGFHSLLLIVDT